MIEYLIIAAVVLWSAWFVFHKIMPQTARKVYAALSAYCQKLGWHRLAQWLKPSVTATGCGGSCGCGSESKTPKQHHDTVQSIKWK